MFLSILFVVAAVGVVVIYRHLAGNITGLDLGSDHDGRSSGAALNILLLGSDTRVGQGKLADKKDLASGARSDTAILLHINAARNYAIAASIPRDSMVAFPECSVTNDQSKATIGSETSPAVDHKQFNEAFTIGGPVCTTKVVEKNTGLFVDHFAAVDFNGFKDMVNGLGGVSICVPRAIKDKDSHLDIPAGTQTLNGDQALAFVRTRHAVGDGSDLGRIKLQQAFLSAMVRQATDAGLLLQPTKLYNFLNAATGSLTTDSELASGTALAGLANQVRGLKPSAVHFVTVPTEPYPADKNRVQWTSSANQIWDAMKNDTPLPGTSPAPGSSASSTAAAVDPASVHVRLVNRTGVSGLAKQAGAALQVQGFQVAEPGTKAVSATSGVVVRYPDGQEQAAKAVAAAFKGATVKVDHTLVGSTVVAELGPGTPKVTVVPSAASTSLPAQPLSANPSSRSASPSGKASPSAQNAADDNLCKSGDL